MVSKSQLLSFLLSVNCSVDAFHVATRLFAVASFGRGPEALPHPRYNYLSLLSSASSSQGSNSESDRSGKNNKAMSFLKKIGKVGGAANRDFRYAIGVDEGPSGKSAGNGLNILKKAEVAFKSCIETGIVDNMAEPFPLTSSGAQWAGFTDRVMGGVSMGNLSREVFDGRIANVLRGSVSLANNGGFIQMATNLARTSEERSSVDASSFEGVELDVQSFSGDNGSESFNVHLKNVACPLPYTSYRATFEAPNGKWTTIRIPFGKFRGKGPGVDDTPFDTSTLTRVGIVAIGRPMKVQLAVAGFRFY